MLGEKIIYTALTTPLFKLKVMQNIRTGVILMQYFFIVIDV